MLSARTDHSCGPLAGSCRCCSLGSISGPEAAPATRSGDGRANGPFVRPTATGVRLGSAAGISPRFSCQMTSRTNGPFVLVETRFCRCLLIVSSQGSPLRGGQRRVREWRANGTFMLGERPGSLAGSTGLRRGSPNRTVGVVGVSPRGAGVWGPGSAPPPVAPAAPVGEAAWHGVPPAVPSRAAVGRRLALTSRSPVSSALLNVKIHPARTVTPGSAQTAKPRPTRSGELRSPGRTYCEYAAERVKA